MDDADRADQEAELRWVELERRLAALKRTPPRSHCQDCGLILPEHRRAYGLCLPCAERAEARLSMRARMGGMR
jgi:hypothetical protein